MAAVIMEHQAQLLNRWLVGFCLLFFACNPSNKEQDKAVRSEKPAYRTILLVNQSDSSIRNQNGILYQKNQLFTGRIYGLYPSSADTAAIQEFENGLENGEWKKWYPGHQIKEIRFFENGKKIGLYTIYWENGKKQLEYHFVNDEYEGLCREWNEAGNITREMNYVKGHEEGSQKWWYDNGKIKANYVIINGRRFGLLGTKNCVNVSDSIFKK
ncbi:MAG: toxin-antitoxin system YwqK family antitoxin [Sphingobacteriia bacterium]|jgi:antitoxin component YwqK of YwqJK toxin-antitoxin module